MAQKTYTTEELLKKKTYTTEEIWGTEKSTQSTKLTLKDFREIYPEYNDLDDLTFATKLTARYPRYSYLLEEVRHPSPIKTPLPQNSSDYTALLIIGIVLLILLILFGGKLIRAVIATLRRMTKQVFQTTIIWLMGIGISIISFKVLTRWRYCKYPFYYLVTNALPILIFGGLCLFASRRPKEIKWLMWIAIIILLIIEFFLIIQSVPSPITRRVPF